MQGMIKKYLCLNENKYEISINYNNAYVEGLNKQEGTKIASSKIIKF